MRAAARGWLASGFALVVTFGASSGRADDSAAAQALFDQAKKAMAAQNLSEACPKFEESYRLQEAMGTLLNLADCYERAGQLAAAWSKFLELASKARAAGQQARARIGRQRAAALAPRLSHLIINVGSADRSPGLEVRRDGTVVGQAEWGAPIPADAGSHTVEASAPGKQGWTTTVALGGHATTLTIEVPELVDVPVEPKAPQPEPSASAAPSGLSEVHGGALPPKEASGGGLGAQKVLAIVSGVVGVAGVGVGTYFGLASMSKHKDAEAACSQMVCMGPDASNGVALWNDARSAGNLSTVAFVVGGTAAAGALALWFTAPRVEGASAPRAEVGIGPGTIQWKAVW